MHNLHTQYVQRWRRLYSQTSEQRSDTSAINRQVIVDSTSNVTVLSGKIRLCVDASQCVRLDNAFIRKAAYTVAIIVTVVHNPRHAFIVTRNKSHVLRNRHHFVYEIIISNT